MFLQLHLLEWVVPKKQNTHEYLMSKGVLVPEELEHCLKVEGWRHMGDLMVQPSWLMDLLAQRMGMTVADQ